MATPTDLADIREQIDALDSQLRDLLLARAELVDAVAAAKANSPDQGSLRPIREAEQTAALAQWQAENAPNMPLSGLVALWREIISMGLAQQGGLTIYHPEQSGLVARTHFGASLSYQTVASSADALSRAASGAADKKSLAIIPLADAVAGQDELHLVARLPAIGPPQALCYGPATSEQDGDCVTLIKAARDAAVLAQGQVIYRDGDVALCEVDSFDETLADGCIVLGRYPRPLPTEGV